MSSNKQERIKGIRQYLGKNHNPLFGDFIPFGAEGQYIDMYSGLDLEEQLILGGNKTTTLSFTTFNDGTEISTIIEYYNQENGTVYTKVTYIKETPVVDTIEGNDENSIIGGTEPQNVVIGNFRGKNNMQIDINLYKGEYVPGTETSAIFLHHKKIFITTNDQGLDEIIETLDLNQEGI